MISTKSATLGLVIIVLSCVNSLADATVQQLNSATDLDLSSNIVYAINLGNNGNPNVGGITFAEDQDYSEITLDVLGEGPSTWFGSAASTGDVGVDQLLNGMAYRNGSAPLEISFNIGQLSIGTLYRLQLMGYEPQDTNRDIDILVEDTEIVTAYNPIDEQGGVTGHSGSVIKYDFVATDRVLNIRMVSNINAVALSGFTLAVVPCEYNLAGDLNDDCRVDFLDFALMADNWLTDCYQDPDDPACTPK